MHKFPKKNSEDKDEKIRRRAFVVCGIIFDFFEVSFFIKQYKEEERLESLALDIFNNKKILLIRKEIQL